MRSLAETERQNINVNYASHASARLSDEPGQVHVPLPAGSTVEDVDTALYRIESEISDAINAGKSQQQISLAAPVDPDELEDDGGSDMEDDGDQ